MWLVEFGYSAMARASVLVEAEVVAFQVRVPSEFDAERLKMKEGGSYLWFFAFWFFCFAFWGEG